MSEGEAREQFITQIKNLRDQMAAVGIKKTSEELASFCIRVLPRKYDSLATALNTQVRTPPLTFEEFGAMLVEEEMRLKARDGTDTAFSANAKKGKGKGSGNPNASEKKKKNSKTKCFYCDKPGHVISLCRLREADEKNGTLKPSKKKESGNSAEVELELFVAH